MDSRVLGSGAIVCSALVLWSQPSAPEHHPDECQDDANPTACAAQNPAGQVQPASPRSSSPETSQAPNLPFNLQWSGMVGSGGTADAANQVPKAMEDLYGELLTQAETAATQDRLAIALTNVAGIPKNSQHYARAQQLQENWAQELLQRAAAHCQQGQIETALSMVNAIPPTSQRYARATELRNNWSQQAALLDRATAAKNSQNWRGVIQALSPLQGTPLYSSRPVQELLQDAIYHSFRPDDALMQIASGAGIPSASSTTAAPIATAAIPTDQTSPSVEPPANVADLPIDLAQAIAWAQPTTAAVAAAPSSPSNQMVAALPSTPPSRPTADRSSSLPVQPPAEAQPLTLPDVTTIPISKFQLNSSFSQRVSTNPGSDTQIPKTYPQ